MTTGILGKKPVLVSLAFVLGGLAGGMLVGTWPRPQTANVASPATEAESLLLGKKTESAGPAGESALQALGQALGDREQMDKARSLISAAAAFSPEQTLAKILAIEDRRMKQEMLGGLMQTWLLRDPEAAMQALADAGIKGSERENVLQRALNGMADTHPTGAFALLKKHPDLAGEGLYRDIFEKWGQSKTSAGAMSAIEGISSLAWRREAIDGLAEALGETNMDSALAWAKELPNTGDREFATRKALEQNLYRDPQRVAEEWTKLTSGSAKTELAAELARAWSRRDPDAALDWATNKLTGATQEQALGRIAQTLMGRDLPLAQTIIEGLPPGERRDALFGQIARNMAMSDVNAAWKWADGQQGAAKDNAYREVARQWAEHDPKAAAEHALRQLSDPQQQTRVLGEIGAQWARHDPAAAALWAANLPGEVGKEATKSALRSWERENPAAAQAHALAMPEGQAKTEVAREMLERQLNQGVASSAQWLNQWNGSAAQPELTREVASRWLREDSMQASQWMASMSPGPSRDAAVSALVRTIGREDPEAARQWVGTVSDPAMRASMQERLARR